MLVKSMTTTQAQKNFGSLVESAVKEPVSITKHMKEVFVIVPSREFYKMKKLADSATQKIKKKKTLMDFMGAGKEFSRFSTVEQVDEFISSNRELWKV